MYTTFDVEGSMVLSTLASASDQSRSLPSSQQVSATRPSSLNDDVGHPVGMLQHARTNLLDRRRRPTGRKCCRRSR